MAEEKDREEEPNTPWWKAHLNIVGLFIGTHGLAVFLVVYYTMYLYPRAELERGNWIEQITRVRQLLEPETRTLTVAQAEAVLSIAKTAFIQQLELEMQVVDFGPRTVMARAVGPVGSAGSSTEQRTWVWDEMYTYRTRDAGEAATAELVELLRRFNSAFERRQAEYRRQMISVFDRVRSRNEVLRYQLGRLRTDQASLDEVWQKATEQARQQWAKAVDSLENERDFFSTQEFARFIAQHPAYQTLGAKESKSLRYLEPRASKADASPLSAAHTGLEQEIVKEIRKKLEMNGRGQR